MSVLDLSNYYVKTRFLEWRDVIVYEMVPMALAETLGRDYDVTPDENGLTATVECYRKIGD